MEPVHTAAPSREAVRALGLSPWGADASASNLVTAVRLPDGVNLAKLLRHAASQDAQFTAGEAARMALAYWDADGGPAGWEEDGHVQTANQGWIEVTLAAP